MGNGEKAEMALCPLLLSTFVALFIGFFLSCRAPLLAPASTNRRVFHFKLPDLVQLVDPQRVTRNGTVPKVFHFGGKKGEKGGLESSSVGVMEPAHECQS